MTGLITITIVLVTRFSLTLWTSALDETPLHPVSTELVNTALGDYRLAVPENLLSRNESVEDLDKMEIAVLWPELAGRSNDNARQFTDRSSQSTVIYLRLDNHADAIGTEERFVRILSPAFAGAPLPGPNGLTGQRFQPGTGFGPDILYYGTPSTSSRYLIFCSEPFDQSPRADTAFCQRLTQIEPDLRLEIRFRPALLQDWQAIEEQVTALIRGFVATD